MAKRWKKHVGMALVLAGVILLIVSFVAGWTHINGLMLTAWLCVVLGVVVHVWNQKKQSKY